MRARLLRVCTSEHVLALLRILCVRAYVRSHARAYAGSCDASCTRVRTYVVPLAISRAYVRRLAAVRPPVRTYFFYVPLGSDKQFFRAA